MITIAIGIIGTITIGMIGTTMIETTRIIETNEFFIYSGPEKNRNKDGGDQAGVGDSAYRLLRLTNLAAKNPSISFWGGKVVK